MFGQRLRMARKKAGLSMRELAKCMSPSVSPQAISKYEAGKMMPSSSVLVGLGQTLNVSLDFLMGGQVETLEAVEFRKHSRTSAKDRVRAEVLVTEQIENYLAVERILDLEPAPDPFDGLRTDKVQSLEEAEALAIQLRERWRLGLDPIPSMTGLLESKGIKVIAEDLPKRFDGLACTVKLVGGQPDADAVVVSSRANVERRRFTLAHELGHRVIGGSASPSLKPEDAMHRFAAAFLVPADHLRAQVGRSRSGFTFNELSRLKRFYGVSAAAMLIRLGDVGVLAKSRVAHGFRTYARTWRRREPDPIGENTVLGAFEKPQRFENLVWRGLGERLFSTLRAAQLLGRPVHEVERGVGGPHEQ
ncbi:MAG: XRE family transcriptional regulator [Gammaproteobacteria bacterium]|nr:XRE family transcriptional regulator [Gammaproteobacteria bacterium]